ncbi:titin isoform X6 [Chironomus tepperi]
MSSEENIIAMPADNSIASDSISAKLIEVSRVAESLDAIIHETQDALNIFENNSSTAATLPVASTSSVDGKTSSANTSDDWNNSLKSSTEDESFVTASEYATSRSSSYHTASECRDHSPWWTDTAERSSVDLDSSDPEQPNIKELTITSSSGNGSFDNSEASFRSPIPSSLFNDQNDSSDSAIKLKTDNESESSSSPSLPPKIPSPHEEYTLPPLLSSADKKIYTIFESPTSTPSQDDERIENESPKVAEPYLQVDRAANCIEKTLDAFSSRQLEISGIWENFNTTKEISIILEKIMAENIETISLTAKIEDELYPILATSEELPRDLIRFVDNKLKSVQNEIQQSEVELSQRIEKIDKLDIKDQVSSEKVVQVKNNLNSIKTKLFSISADYNELVDIVLSFLRQYQEIYESIREYFSVRDQFAAPVGGENVANLIRDYETFKNNTMESFRSLLAQSEKLIDRIKMQEPPGAKEQDTDKIITLLENLRTYFESNAASENSELKRQFFITEFEKLLKDLNENISDLQLQFNDMNDKFGDSAAACKVSSLSYEYYERNVDLLNKRIENFINSYSNISYPDAKPYVSDELMKLLKRWDDFKNQSARLKSNLSLAQQYFSLLENVETRYHKTYTFLVNSVNLRKDELKTSAAAFDLIDELEKYVVDNKQAQLDDLKKLSQISKDVFGYDKTENLYADNIFIFQSFEKMKSDIVDLVKDLKRKEDPVAMINEIDNKILVIESHEEVLRNETIHEIVPVIENEPPKFLRYLESAEVTEGDNFIFECILTGHPEPSVQWLKYNSPLADNPNYKISFVGGKCRLEIPKVTSADAAVFSCIATNVAGTSQTTANLIVKPKQEVQPLTPPSFLRLLQNAYANERSTFEFNCLVDGNPLPTVQWYRNDMCVDNDINYNITYNNGNALLRIPTVRVEDQGIFTVKAINQMGYNECSAILSVEAVEKNIKPTIKSPLSNVLTRAGQKITLECNIAGKPQPEIYVMHNGKILSDHDVNLQYDGETVRLTLPQTASVKDSGIYKVIGRNIAGEASTECFVQVEQQEEVQAPIQPKLIKPSIQQPLKDISVFEGKPIHLESIIVGQPEPEVIWLHNDKPVKESNDIRLYFQGDTCTLYINEVYLEDAGVYKIIAINSAGEASSECRVSVTPLNILEPAIRPTESERFLSSSVMPPKFEKLLTDGLANEGETVELECCLVSGPLPEIKWYLNNKEIVYNDRIQAVANEDGALKLIIRNVLPDDKGVYTVKATNSTGIAKCFSHLIVKSNANSSGDNLLSRMEPEPEKIICPTFKELFADRSVNYGDSTKFECIVYGKPTPKIKWYFNDMPVHGRDFLISTSGDRQVLTIPNVAPETVGKISCIAENEAGKATCVAMLSGSGIPLSTEEQFTTQEDISGSSFITMQKHITTTTTTKQSNVFGNGVPPQSQFHSTSEQIDSSYKKVGDAPAEVSESKKFEEVRESSAEPQQTFAQKLLNFSRNDMTNEKHESIIAQSGQISTGKPIRRSTAPRFVSPLIGKIVDQGVDVVLESIVDGYPTPTVEVTKNDEIITSVPGTIEISYSLNKIVIKLFNVSTKDAGRYSAIAKNDAGSATSTADVVVKKSIFPPVFGRRLQAQVVKKGERVIMDCEITGTPEPQVSWYKDDRPIAQAMANEYRITQLGICHKLIIENVKVQDTGKYMVKAVNSGGEAQSIADFMVLESQPDRMVEVTKTVVFSDLPSNQIKTGPILDQSIPKENGISKENYSAQQELSSKAQLGSSTESKVIMETTRTTSTTMRLEHKPQFNDLPPITFSQRTQTPTIPLVSEGTMVDSELSVSKHSEQTQTDGPKPREFEIPIRQELPKEPERPKDIPFPFVETPKVIQTPEPIRKSALEFFENNLKNLPELNQDRYTRYEDAVKGSHTYVSKQQEIKEQFHTKLNDDLSYFNLKPEPPAELSFMPKTQPVGQPEKIIEKVKKLEEVHQTSETPLSGTIHQPMYKKEEKFEKKEFTSTKSTTPFVPKVATPTFAPHVHQLIPDTRVGRSPSPKPSTEGVNMEKLWAMKPKTPEPFAAPQQIQQTQEDYKQQSFTHEHKSSFVAYSSQKTVKQEVVEPPKEHFVPIQPYQAPPVEQPAPVEELPKTSIKDTKSFFEQRIKEEEVKSTTLPDLKAPSLVKQFAKPMVPLVPDNYELGIEPGAPPEICYAPKPVLERKQSYVEKIEKTLEQNIEKEPDRVPRGGVRIFPTRQTPNRMSSQSPQRFQSPKPVVQQQLPKPAPQPVYHPPEPVFKAPEPVFKAPEPEPVIKAPEPVFKAPEPVLQPEPQPIFMTQPIQPPKGPEPFIPEKFESHESHSEFKKEETISGYRRVAPPKFLERGKSSEPTFVPPPKFESPTFTKKSEPIIRDVPISVQKQEPIKQQPAAQPAYQSYQQQTKQQTFVQKTDPVKQPAPQPLAPMPLIQPGPQPIYQNYQSSSHQEQTFIKKTETIKQSGPQPSPQPAYQPQMQQSSLYTIQKQTAAQQQQSAPQPQQQQQPAPQPQQQQQSVPQPKQIIKPSAVKPKGKFEDFVSETQESFQSMYKNFVKSEQSQHTTESYFQRIASPKTISQPSPQQQQTPTQSQLKKPEQSQDTSSTQMMKNISMTSKQIKINEEPITIQPVTQTSTSHYTSHKSEQSYESESKYQQTWRPSSEHCYKPVTPNLPQTPQHFSSHIMQSPPAPSAFETPLQYTGTARPKFEPIDKPIPIQHVKKVEQKQPKVFKPTPVTPAYNAYSNHLENSSQQSNQTKSYYYTTSAPQSTTKTYYTAVAGQPVHNAIAHETSNTMHMKESTEQSHRVVNITQTRRVISLDGPKKEEEKLEPFPFSPEPGTYYQKPRVPPPPTPTKFIRGEFRESDYDSDLENARIRPIWTPSQQHAHDNLQYRPVRPPSSRSSSVPPSTRHYDRVKTPMEFDTEPVIMPTRIKIESPSLKTPQQYFSSSLYRDQIKEKKIPIVTRDDIGIQKSSFNDHASTMNAAFKTKAHQFMKDVMVEQQQQQQKQQKPILKKAGSVGAGDGQGSQAYREESRVSQYGTKHVDPDTGIIYFKYDFGYEFGVIFQDGKKVVGGIRNNQNETKRVLPERTSDIEVPVLHEKTGRASVVSFGATTPIEFERLDKAKKRYSLPTPSSNDRFTPKNGTIQASEYSTNIVYDRSGSNTPFDIVNQQKQGAPKNPPMFITPLKDIAVVAGQTARFECIVQCDPHTVYWMKDGQILENSFKFQIEYRNGVCRCTIPQASKDDAGTFECIAQNNMGTDTTAAMLIIPGDKRGFRIF